MMPKRKRVYIARFTFTLNVPIEASSPEVAFRKSDRYTLSRAYDEAATFNYFPQTVCDAETYDVLLDAREVHPNPADPSPWKRPGYPPSTPPRCLCEATEAAESTEPTKGDKDA